MDSAEREALIAHYVEMLAKHGPSHRALGWSSKTSQTLRFEILSTILPGTAANFSILDLGCGFGDLYQHLVAGGFHPDYTGIDICPEFVRIAKELHPTARFTVADLLDLRDDERFDFVFCSGLFNSRLKDNESFLRTMLAKMFALTRNGVAVNMLTKEVDYMEAHLYYYDPEKVMRWAQQLSRRCWIESGYGLFEFSLFLQKEPRQSPVLATDEHRT